MWRSARRGMYGSATWVIEIADCTRVGGARLLEEVLERERVHDGAEHAHVVGATAVHAALTELGTAEEVAAADDDRDLDAVHRFGDLARDLAHDVGVDAELSAAERLAGEFQKDSPGSGRLIDHVSSSRRVQNYPSEPVGIAPGMGKARIESDAGLSTVLSADLEAGEARHGESGVLGDLGDGLLVVLRVVLVEQRDLLEERVRRDPRRSSAGRPRACPPGGRSRSTISRSLSTSASGTSSRDRYVGFANEMCCAMLRAVSASSPV